MRSPLLAVTLGLSLVGCLVGDMGDPASGGGDDDGSNGSNGQPGGGPGGNPTTPQLNVTVDKTALPTELLSTNMVTVTLHGAGGFSGPVTLAASAVDANGAAVAGWTVALDQSTVNVAANGTATAVATLKIPSQSTALSGSLKVEATTASLGVKTAISTVTVANQLSLKMTLAGATCGPSPSPSLTISQGTKVVWQNADTAKRVTIHIQSGGGTQGIKGFSHEPDPGMAPAGTTGDTFTQTAQGAGTITWYCHAPGTDNNRYTITAAP